LYRVIVPFCVAHRVLPLPMPICCRLQQTARDILMALSAKEGERMTRTVARIWSCGTQYFVTELETCFLVGINSHFSNPKVWLTSTPP
jgi:hypothetical protein